MNARRPPAGAFEHGDPSSADTPIALIRAGDGRTVKTDGRKGINRKD